MADICAGVLIQTAIKIDDNLFLLAKLESRVRSFFFNAENKNKREIFIAAFRLPRKFDTLFHSI